MNKKFRRKLERLVQGTVYYRIWGWPIKERNKEYFMKKDGYTVLFHRGHHIAIGVVREEIKNYVRVYRHLPLEMTLACSLKPNRLFQKKSQAMKLFNEYAQGIRDDGMDDLLKYHLDIDCFENIWENTSESWAEKILLKDSLACL